MAKTETHFQMCQNTAVFNTVFPIKQFPEDNRADQTKGTETTLVVSVVLWALKITMFSHPAFHRNFRFRNLNQEGEFALCDGSCL